MPVSFPFWWYLKWICCLGIIATVPSLTNAAESEGYPSLTQIGQFAQDARAVSPVNYHLQLDADVWWVDVPANRLVLHDASGTSEVELDLQDQPLEAGQRIHVEGYGSLVQTANGFRFGVIGPVVDNDGVHSMIEKSGSVYLPSGSQPF